MCCVAVAAWVHFDSKAFIQENQAMTDKTIEKINAATDKTIEDMDMTTNKAATDKLIEATDKVIEAHTRLRQTAG